MRISAPCLEIGLPKVGKIGRLCTKSLWTFFSNFALVHSFSEVLWACTIFDGGVNPSADMAKKLVCYTAYCKHSTAAVLSACMVMIRDDS